MAGTQTADEPRQDEPGYSGGPHRAAITAWAVLSALVAYVVIQDMASLAPGRATAAAIALAVGLTTTGWHIADRPRGGIPPLVTLTGAGLAGAALIGLVPGTIGYVIIFIAVLALGTSLPPDRAIAASLVIFAAATIVVLTASKMSIAEQISNDVGGAFLTSLGVFTRYARISQARAEHLLAQLQAAQADRARAVILTERTRLAREIHDILAHSLSGLVLALDTAELLGRRSQASPEDQAKILEQVARARRIARDGLGDARRAVAALRGDELPGPALLERLVRDTSETADIHAGLTTSGVSRPLPPEVGLALYRTAQEALINSAKYAGHGATATMRLDYRTDSVALDIEDFRSPAASSLPAPIASGLTFGGYGLAGMRERAELLGGDLTAGPTESGFRVTLRLPATEAT
jgi:signal transduction histidine kinase